MSILDVAMNVYITVRWSCNVVAENIDRNLMENSGYILDVVMYVYISTMKSVVSCCEKRVNGQQILGISPVCLK